MKKDFIQVLSTLTLLVTPVLCEAKDTLAILATSNISEKPSASQTSSATEIILQAISKTNRFNIIERSQLEALQKELKIQRTKDFDEKTASAIGKLSGAKFVVLSTFNGSTTPTTQDKYENNRKIGTENIFKDVATINLKLVSTETGKIYKTIQASSNSTKYTPAEAQKSSQQDLQEKLNREFSNAFSINGYIIKSKGNGEFIIDIGTDTGLAKGDSLNIFLEEDDITHPVTGKVIKGDRTIIGSGTIIDAQPEIATLKADTNIPITLGKTRVESKEKQKGILESVSDFLPFLK